MPDGQKKPKPHFHGHRDRLRQKFLERGPDALEDYELLELILFAAIPRVDVKPIAKKLLLDHKNLWNVVQASSEKLTESGLKENAIAAIKAVGATALRAQKSELIQQPVLSSWTKIIHYCQAAMEHSETEQFRVLFMDRKHRLIADEVQQTGTIDHTPVYPREVVKRALAHGAAAVILVHNHPSGDTMPSAGDIAMTKQVIAALKAVDVIVHDHLIVGRQAEPMSFKTHGLL